MTVTTGLVARNRKARHNYHIEDTIETGLVLTGSEVKSLRNGTVNISEAYAAVARGEIWLVNAHISEYKQAGQFNHDPLRRRKLLLRRREIARLAVATERAGMTLVPLSLYFNNRGIAKLELGLGKGKRQYDKRETSRKRDWDRQKARLLRDRG